MTKSDHWLIPKQASLVRVKMNNEDLIRVMKAENLNVKRVSAILSVTPTTVYRWIKGTRRIPDRVSQSLPVLLKNRPKYLRLSGSDWRVD